MLPRAHAARELENALQGAQRLQAATTATTLATAGVGGDGSAVLNAADLDASTGERTKSSLATRAGGLGALATGATDLDVQSTNAELLAASSDILGGKHRRIGGRLVTVSLHLHATSDTHQGVVVRGVDAGNAEHNLVLLELLGEDVELGSLLSFGFFLCGGHVCLV